MCALAVALYDVDEVARKGENETVDMNFCFPHVSRPGRVANKGNIEREKQTQYIK